jgi:hypothetical protein
MSIEFSSSLTKISSNWTSFKSSVVARDLVQFIQYDDNGDIYFIFLFDGPIVFSCVIWKNIVPDGVIENYSQNDNDIDKADFEDNYKATSNTHLTKYSNTGVIGSAPAKGLGGFVPNPFNDPYEPNIGETSALYVDGEGSLVTRGAVITDEGSFRDDFTGSDLLIELTGTVTLTNGSTSIIGSGTLFLDEITRDNYIKIVSHDNLKWVKVLRTISNTEATLSEEYSGATTSDTAHKTFWIPSINEDASAVTSGSKTILSSGLNSSSHIKIYRFGDYCPIIGFWKLSISQRIVDQELFLGLRDDVDSPSMYCDVIFDGVDDTKIKFRSAWGGDEELTEVALPVGLVTSQSLKYKIDVSPDYCGLLINNLLVAKHDSHIPGMYSEIDPCMGIINTATQTIETDLEIDTFYFSNQDIVQVSSAFIQPLPTIIREDQHTLNGKLTTTATTSDQIVLELEVPANKIFHIIGYKIDTSGPSSGTVKIGRNDVSNEPGSPGEIDNNLFRVFDLNSGTSTGDVDFNIPRKVATSGETVYVTVTPTSSVSTSWRATIDYGLR